MSSVLRIVFLVILYWESAWPHHLCCNWIKFTHLPKTWPADSILILQTEVLFFMHRFHGTKGNFRACDAANASQDTELPQRDVFSYFLHCKMVQTDHTFCVNIENLTCGRKKLLALFASPVHHLLLLLVKCDKLLRVHRHPGWGKWVMECAVLHTHCSLFLIIAQQVKNHYSVLFYCFFFLSFFSSPVIWGICRVAGWYLNKKNVLKKDTGTV